MASGKPNFLGIAGSSFQKIGRSMTAKGPAKMSTNLDHNVLNFPVFRLGTPYNLILKNPRAFRCSPRRAEKGGRLRQIFPSPRTRNPRQSVYEVRVIRGTILLNRLLPSEQDGPTEDADSPAAHLRIAADFVPDRGYIPTQVNPISIDLKNSYHPKPNPWQSVAVKENSLV